MFDTLNAYFKLSLNGGRNSTLEIHIIWGFFLTPLSPTCQHAHLPRRHVWLEGLRDVREERCYFLKEGSRKVMVTLVDGRRGSEKK